MIQYGINVGGEREVEAIFDRLPDVAHDQIVETMHGIVDWLRGSIEDRIPTGQKNDLKGLLQSGVEDRRDRVRGWVSMAGGDPKLVRQAAALEYGSTGRPFAVTAYTRRLDQVFGVMTEPFDQLVGAYRRVGGLDPELFLRGPLQQDSAGALAELNRAFEAAVKEATNG